MESHTMLTCRSVEDVRSFFKASFNTACPRGTLQRFVATEVLPIAGMGIGGAALVGTCVYGSSYLGHSIGVYLYGGAAEHANAFLVHPYPAASEKVTDFLLGAVTILCSGGTIFGAVEGVKSVVERYATWRKEESKDVDVELAMEKDAQAHKAS